MSYHLCVTVIGIDPSSKKLAFCVTGKRFKIAHMHKKSLPEGVLHATGAAFEEAFLFFQNCPSARVYMEAPLVGRSAYATIVQAQVGGAVLAAACKAGVNVELVNVNSWKSQVVGNGHASKEQVREWLEENIPHAYILAGGDQDLIDAAAITQYGVQHESLRQSIMRRYRALEETSSEEASKGRTRRYVLAR